MIQDAGKKDQVEAILELCCREVVQASVLGFKVPNREGILQVAHVIHVLFHLVDCKNLGAHGTEQQARCTRPAANVEHFQAFEGSRNRPKDIDEFGHDSDMMIPQLALHLKGSEIVIVPPSKAERLSALCGRIFESLHLIIAER